MSSEAGAAWAKPRWVALIAVLAGLVLPLGACGGSPGNGNAAVAHLGSTTTTKASSSQGNGAPPDATSGGGGGPGPGGGPAHGIAMADPGASQSQLVAFAHCMQTHGVPTFPEPNAQGVFSGPGVNNNATGFRTAANHCSHLLPNGGKPTPAQDEQAVAQALGFSRCMRAHGIADYPDPRISNGGADINISLRGGPGSDLDPNNPRFQAAQQACGGANGGGPPLGGGPKPSSGGGAK